MLAKKKLLFLLFGLASLLILPGCWDNTEIEDLGIAGVMGIDKVTIQGREQYLVMLQVLKLVKAAGAAGDGGGGVGGQASSILYKGIGLTIDDALANIQATTPRRLFLADLGAIIVSEKVATENLEQVVDFLARSRDIRLLRGLLVAKENLESILQAQPQFSLTLGQEIKDTVEITRGFSAKVYYPNIKEFINELMSPSASSVTGILKTASQIELSPQNSGPGGSEKTTIGLDGLAVFSQGKKVGELTITETVGYLLLQEQGQGGVIPVQSFTEDSIDFSFRVTNLRAKKIPLFDPELKGFKVELFVEGDISALNNVIGKLDPELLDLMEEQLAWTIKYLTENTLRKTQDQRADVFGLGNILYAKHPKVWEQVQETWPETYQELSLEVVPEIRIENTGFFLDMIRF